MMYVRNIYHLVPNRPGPDPCPQAAPATVWLRDSLPNPDLGKEHIPLAGFRNGPMAKVGPMSDIPWNLLKMLRKGHFLAFLSCSTVRCRLTSVSGCLPTTLGQSDKEQSQCTRGLGDKERRPLHKG